MTREEIIRMAREAGLSRIQADLLELGKEVSFDSEMLADFAALVAAAEREECAKVCDEVNKEYDGEEVSASWIAAAIRARGA